MPTVDDELTRRLQRAERPVDGDGVFDGLVARRSHRERLRRVQAGLVAFAVLAATAGGFLALQDAFRQDRRNVGNSTLPGNGEIVFTKEADDDRLEIFAATADGSVVRQLTDTEPNNSDPAVSPDGRTVAFSHQTEGGATIATIPIEGGPIGWQTGEHRSVSDPVWSPDGSRIAFLAFTSDASELYVAEVGTDVARRIELAPEVTSSMPSDGLDTLEHPTWSPDGERIAVAVRTQRGRSIPSWDVLSMRPDGSGTEFVVATGSRDETVPAWSPDGTRIAFLQWPAAKPQEIEQRQTGGELWTATPDGGSPRQLAVAVDALLRLGLTWAPDGSSLLVSDGEWIYRVDPTPEGDVRDNFIQLVRGFSPSWQPIPAGSEPSVTNEPARSVSPSPEPEGRDIGLGFPICNAERLDGIDWYGDGTLGAAWTGARVTDGGTCPASGAGEYIVTADLDGDGMAEPGGMGFLDHCLLCQPVAATDLSGDGVLELVVLEEASSTPSYSLYEVSLPTSERSPGIYPLFVALPGYPAGGFPGGEPIRVTAGGDEGYAAAIDCEGGPDAPVLVVAWSNYQVEVDDTEDVYVTRLRLGDDGAFHVIAGEHFTQAVDDPLPIDPAATACGVAFDPFA